MYENAKHPTAKKVKEFCENAVIGICRYLRLTPTGAKVCIRETEYATEIKAKPNCQQTSVNAPPCKHSATPIDNNPGKLKCKDCEKIRNCEHPLIGINKERLDYCLICGLILGTGKIQEG